MDAAWVAAAAIVVLVVFGVVFLRKTSQRYAALWPPLAAVVSGTASGHRLEGTWQGHPVTARVISASDETSTTYFFAVAVRGQEIREPIRDAYDLPTPERFQEQLAACLAKAQ